MAAALETAAGRFQGVVSSRAQSRRRGTEVIILGSTEIMLLVSTEDSTVPLFDTTTIHAIAAVDRALALPVPA